MECPDFVQGARAATETALAAASTATKQGSADVSQPPIFNPLRASNSLLYKLGRGPEKRRQQQRRNTCSGGSRIVAKHPLVITRVDQPWEHPQALAMPALDIGEIIRRRADQIDSNDAGGVSQPHSASADSSYTLINTPLPRGTPMPSRCRPVSSVLSESTATTTSSSIISSSDLSTPPTPMSGQPRRRDLFGEASSGFSRPSTASSAMGRPSTSGDSGKRRLRHDYFRVATMDGKPAIPARYKCPIAMCEQPFAQFEQLQLHWTEHPWNRGGILTPVCDGGTRRLGWWEHKRKFFASMLRGSQVLEFPEDFDLNVGEGKKLRRRATSMDEACRSDYGDISLFGARTYHVSPRVVPMWQVAQWEAKRDAKAAAAAA
ncbi:hypothetical protein GQ54DRAFT_178436 [Martensiomyces pterosporus]|nr:hypothetical protein GQ54DRAFT_178436 [Martensiomyces pterosporus]